MSNYTLRSLFDLITSRRVSREAYARTMEQASPSERPRWNMQIAVFGHEYRAQLDKIDELPDLLVRVPRLQEGWPYPTEGAFQIFRAELGARTCKSIQEIDAMPLRDIVAGRFDVSSWASQFTDVSGVTAKSTAPIFPSLKHRTALPLSPLGGQGSEKGRHFQRLNDPSPLVNVISPCRTPLVESSSSPRCLTSAEGPRRIETSRQWRSPRWTCKLDTTSWW